MDLDFSPGCVVARTCLVSITYEDTIADRVMPVSFPYPSGSIICNNNVMELKGIISKLCPRENLIMVTLEKCEREKTFDESKTYFYECIGRK